MTRNGSARQRTKNRAAYCDDAVRAAGVHSGGVQRRRPHHPLIG
jgi:hypothetical protein